MSLGEDLMALVGVLAAAGPNLLVDGLEGLECPAILALTGGGIALCPLVVGDSKPESLTPCFGLL